MADRPLFDEVGNIKSQSSDEKTPSVDYSWDELVEKRMRLEALKKMKAQEEETAKLYKEKQVPGRILQNADARKMDDVVKQGEENVKGAAVNYRQDAAASEFEEGNLPANPEESYDYGMEENTAPLGAAPGDPGDPQLTQGDQMMQTAAAAGERARNVLSGHQSRASAMARETAYALSMQTMAMEKLATEGEASARQHMDRLAEAYDEADADLASLRVDPMRWEESTPAVAQVLMALASSAFSFFTGGQGPNPIMSLIENAIERDVEAQKANIDIATKKAGLGIEREEVLGQAEATVRAAIWDRMLNTYSQMAEQGGILTSAEEQEAMFGLLMKKAEDAHTKQLLAHVAKAQKAQAEAGAMESVKWDDTETGRHVTGAPQAVRDIGTLYKMWKVGGESFIGHNPLSGKAQDWAGYLGSKTGIGGSSDMNEYNQARNAKVLALAAEENQGRPSDKDFSAMLGTLPESGIGKEDGAKRFGRSLSKYYLANVDKYNNMSEIDKSRTRKSIQSIEAEIVEVASENPEVIPYIEGELGDLLRELAK